MSCNCNQNIDCNAPMTCLCGVTMDIYNSSTGLLVDSVDFNIYSEDGVNYFQTYDQTIWGSDVPLPISIRYNETDQQWEMSFFSSTFHSDVIIGVLPDTTSPCPTSMCDWDLECISMRLTSISGEDLVVTWTGDFVNGKKSYSFTSDFSGSSIDYVIYFNSISGKWTMKRTDTDLDVGQLTDGSLTCPLGEWMNIPGPGTMRVFTDALGVSGYNVKVYDKECGCCDESLNINFSFNGDDYSVVAPITVDEFGNTLAYNGYPYYSFNITSGDSYMTFYLFFNGEYWGVSQAMSESPIYYTTLNSSNECPFGGYSSGALFDRFSVIGTECFDCCDYYTPRFSNFIKKKKYQLVSDIVDIRPKELFGFKCGPDWNVLFKNHLILDVLHCLPYGVLCEEEEQCLMNNLSENCNC